MYRISPPWWIVLITKLYTLEILDQILTWYKYLKQYYIIDPEKSGDLSKYYQSRQILYQNSCTAQKITSPDLCELIKKKITGTKDKADYKLKSIYLDGKITRAIYDLHLKFYHIYKYHTMYKTDLTETRSSDVLENPL